MAGGIVLSLGNLATQYAWAYIGLSVTEIISSSMVVVIGMIFLLCFIVPTIGFFFSYQVTPEN